MDLNLHLQLLLITNFEIFHSNKPHIQLEEPINLAQLRWKQCQISGSLGRLINSPLKDCLNFVSAKFELTYCVNPFETKYTLVTGTAMVPLNATLE